MVRVNGEVVHTGSLKLADVSTGLDITVTSASGLQCKDDTQTATIKFVEGFNSAITDMDSLVLNLRGIPDGVTVMASMMGTGTALEMTDLTASPQVISGDLAPLTLDASMGLVEDTETNEVMLEGGMGEVVYAFDDEDANTDDVREGTDPMKAKEWNELELTFTWEAGAPPLEMGYVTVSFHPVSTDTDDDMRFIAGPTNMVVEIKDCVSKLLFPFVTNMHGFETGIALTNTSAEAGSCSLSFVGTAAPADAMEVMVMGESVETFGVSMMAPGFQGYIDATCEFRNGKGFAFIANGAGGMGGPTAAQGYLVAEEIVSSD